MLTQEDLNRKSFKSNELTRIKIPVFDRTFKVNYPDNFETVLHLLKQIQLRKAARSNQITAELGELLKNLPDGEITPEISVLKAELSALEFYRRTINTIYTQIVAHLYFSKRATPLYVQSPVSNPELHNLVVIQYGEYRHRVQISKRDIDDLEVEYRGVYVKPEPSSLVYLSDEQFDQFGFQEIEIIRICRRLSNYIMSVRRKFDDNIRAIHNHNYYASQITKLAAQGLVTIEQKADQKAKAEPKTDKPEPKLAKTIKPRKITFKRHANAEPIEGKKKPLNVIRKRSFVLNK